MLKDFHNNSNLSILSTTSTQNECKSIRITSLKINHPITQNKCTLDLKMENISVQTLSWCEN